MTLVLVCKSIGKDRNRDARLWGCRKGLVGDTGKAGKPGWSPGASVARKMSEMQEDAQSPLG